MILLTNGILMVSAASFTLGAINLTLCFQRRGKLMYLFFALASFGVAAYAPVERAMMLAEQPSEYARLVREGHLAVWFVFVPLVLFVHYYLETQRRWLLWAVIITRSVALVLNWASPLNLNFLEVSAIRKTSFLGEMVSIPVGTPNPLMLIAQASHILALIYFVLAAIDTWRRGNQRRAITIGVSVAIFATATSAMSTIAFWNNSIPLFVSPFFLCILAAMCYELTRDVHLAADLADQLSLSRAELNESREQLNLSANAANVGVWSRDIKTGKFRATDTWFRLFEFERDDALQLDDVFDRIHLLDRQIVADAVEAAAKEGRPYDIQFQVTLPNGCSRWLDSRCKVEFTNGAPAVLRGADFDITEQKMAEESRRNLAAIVESSEDAILSKALDGTILTWNAGAEKIFGYSSGQIIGKNIAILSPNERKQEVAKILHDISQGASIDHFQTVRLTRDGKRIDVSITVSPIRDQHGSILGASVIARDITQQKAAEEALRLSEERFRNIADTAPVLIWISGANKLRTYFNKSWLDFRGRTPDEELGDGWTDGIYHEDLKICLNAYSAAFDQRKQFSIEFRLRRADGMFRWVHDTGVPRFSADGGFQGYIGSCIDINDRREAKEVLQNLTARLISVQEGERSRVARELHDDLSQSLALLSIQLSGLRKDVEDPVDSKMKIDRLISQIQKLSSDIHRISHELHPAKLEQLGLESALRGFCHEVAGAHEIEVEFNAEGISRALPDNVSLCLYRVAQESLQNVVKHSKARSVCVNVVEENGAISLAVTDNGVGFDTQVKTAKESLGLISMNERLRAVGGTIEIHSGPGFGTEIVVHVPLSGDQKAMVERV